MQNFKAITATILFIACLDSFGGIEFIELKGKEFKVSVLCKKNGSCRKNLKGKSTIVDLKTFLSPIEKLLQLHSNTPLKPAKTIEEGNVIYSISVNNTGDSKGHHIKIGKTSDYSKSELSNYMMHLTHIYKLKRQLEIPIITMDNLL